MYRIYTDRKQGEGKSHFSNYSIREAPQINKQHNGVQLYDEAGTETYFIPWHNVDEILNLDIVDDRQGDVISGSTEPNVPDFS